MKKSRVLIYVFLAAFILNLNAAGISANEEIPDISMLMQSGAFVLMDGVTGQVLFEKNMNAKMYPASITKIMTALIALESVENGVNGLNDTVTMSYDAVWTVGRDTSHIALDVDERLALEDALYALSIESANDASNGIAELIGGGMENFAVKMTERARELGAFNTNFANAHGLPDVNHYTTAYDMALIMSQAVKTPEFSKIFSSVSYYMPPTNIRPEEPRYFNRRNSLIEGPHAYDGIIAEKTGWTGDAGLTYAAAAKRGDRTLVAVVMKSPDANARWRDTALLLNYGFDEFINISYTREEIAEENRAVEFSDGASIRVNFETQNNFNRLILKSLGKKDIDISYDFNRKKAAFLLNPGYANLMYENLGEVDIEIYFAGIDEPADINPGDGGEQTNNSALDITAAAEKSNNIIIAALSGIYKIISVILQIIGVLAVIAVILYIRRYIQVKKQRRIKRLRQRNNNNYYYNHRNGG
ncbi:MAG: D-alanyl-D-alanine carboxypeptidase [Oscillospiraceae bacterium]|nr:D-alanyl-D-alanine carboxypeptidase [Oscillospiraceae bacterium]